MKRLLLLGAGYANVSLLKNLNFNRMSGVEIALISDTDCHYHTVLLHEVASGCRQHGVLFSLGSLFDSRVSIIKDRVLEIKEGVVRCEARDYEFDFLVVGLGFSSDSFGVRGISEYAKAITNFDSALNIFEGIKSKVAGYRDTGDRNDLRFVVCGGGFTGLEFVASLAQELDKIFRECGVSDMDRDLAEIVCIDSAPRLLSAFSDKPASVGVSRLEKMGVKVLVNSRVMEVRPNSVVVQCGNDLSEVFAGTIIWTAGVKGNEVIHNSPFFRSVRSRVEVDGFLRPVNQSRRINNVFVIGDCSALADPRTNSSYPPTAQIATRQGAYLAKVLPAVISGDSVEEEFSFVPNSFVCSLGSSFAIASVNGRSFCGYKAYLLKRLIESMWRFKLIGLRALLGR